MQKGYEFREHTADVEFAAKGHTIEVAFTNAILAMFDTIADINALKRSKSKKSKIVIRDTASNTTDLLWVTLQDLLSITDSENVFGYKVEKLNIRDLNGVYRIYAVISAKQQKPKYSNIYVKGVSRFGLEVKEGPKECLVKTVLDI